MPKSKKRNRTMERADFDALVRKARKRAEGMDASEHAAGFATPQSGGVNELVRTAMLAIEAGVLSYSLECILDAYVLLEKFSVAKGYGPPVKVKGKLQVNPLQ